MQATSDPTTERLGVAAMATVGVGIVAVGADRLASVGLPCPFLATTGVPCPACGITRLAGTVAGGDLQLALTTDPAGAVLLALIAALALLPLLSRVGFLDGRRVPVRTVAVLALAAAAGHWATTLAGGGFVTS